MTRNLDPTKWISRGSLVFPVCSRDTPSKRLAGIFSAELIKVETRAIGTPNKPIKTSWKYAGRLFAANLRGEEFVSVGIRINTTQQVFWAGSQPSTYQVSFQPSYWLPNCRLTIWEYRAPLSMSPLSTGNGPDGNGPGLAGTVTFDTIDGGVG